MTKVTFLGGLVRSCKRDGFRGAMRIFARRRGYVFAAAAVVVSGAMVALGLPRSTFSPRE
jgi:hypothetical protein